MIAEALIGVMAYEVRAATGCTSEEAVAATRDAWGRHGTDTVEAMTQIIIIDEAVAAVEEART